MHINFARSLPSAKERRKYIYLTNLESKINIYSMKQILLQVVLVLVHKRLLNLGFKGLQVTF